MRRVVALLAVLVVLLSGCAATKQAPSVTPSAPATQSPAPALEPISQEAVDYARKLGGASHAGQTLYLVVITSDTSEGVVAARYKEAVPHFGDAADYFVTLESAWFPEMRPGTFVLAEAHKTAAKADEARAWWADRVDASWYHAVVEKVTVDTTSPIPVVYVDVD